MLVKDYKNAFPIIIFSLFNWDEIVIIFIKVDDWELTIIDDHGDGLVRLLAPVSQVILLVGRQALEYPQWV